MARRPIDGTITRSPGGSDIDDERLAGIATIHDHEERLRSESLTLVAADRDLMTRLEIVQRAMGLIHAFSVDHTAGSEDETTMQLLGIRLFNAAASGLKLVLSGYYQTAFHQARDIMEVGYLLDHFRTAPEQRGVWKRSDRKTRRDLFDPVKIRFALDRRDGDGSMRRKAEYDKLSELASHATFYGFRLTSRSGAHELGPFVEKAYLLAWLEEAVLRLGPSAVMYANQFTDVDEGLLQALAVFGTDLARWHKPRA